ncbi:MAG: F0F1 ATP synthase subunit A [Actinomycetia bacterium]|nr:F0F1 ATP synthase subunit A [Actinomycetes bacterium]
MTSGWIPMDGGGFTPPSTEDFNFSGLMNGAAWLNKPMLQLVISVILIAVVFVWGSRNLQIVPGKRQWTFEFLYDYIRNTVGRDVIGRDYQKWMPLLFPMFLLIIVNNWFGEFFYFMFPTFSNIGYVYGLVILVFVLFIGVGIKAHGIAYFKLATAPADVPKLLWIIIIPLEILSTFVVRPVTLSVRLFANMFAGHMSVLVFIGGGTYLLTYANNILFNVSGGLSWVLGMAIIGLELFIGYLQAYVFTILTAQYIASSINVGH